MAKRPYRRKHVQGYRSGLEEKNGKHLAAEGIDAKYEPYRIKFTQPEKARTYTPDWVLPNGIVIETKGLFAADDRQKHLWLKEQYPKMDLRFVFSNPRAKIYKGSNTTYADWCHKHGFRFAEKLIPRSWMWEAPKGIE